MSFWGWEINGDARHRIFALETENKNLNEMYTAPHGELADYRTYVRDCQATLKKHGITELVRVKYDLEYPDNPFAQSGADKIKRADDKVDAEYMRMLRINRPELFDAYGELLPESKKAIEEAVYGKVETE